MYNLKPEEREVGRDNYYQSVMDYYTVGPDVSRRGFLQTVVGGSALAAGSLGAAWFKYEKVKDPIRIGIIGTGDEGNVLIGALNPDFVQVTAIADIRPSSIHRAFHGDYQTDETIKVRPGLMAKYGWKTEDEARKHVKVFDTQNGGYEELLKEKDIEGVIIALPLHLHAKASIQAMKAGKHVLTEKLMAHNIAQCKLMGRVSEETKLHCATGHQRHYSILYDNAKNLIKWGVLGELHFIRAQWHRGNLPGRDSWAMPVPGGEAIWGTKGKKRRDDIAKELKDLKEEFENASVTEQRNLLQKKIAQWTKWDEDKTVKAEDFDYVEMKLENGETRTALEELVRWRVWDRTGGGLMAELGSHQLDASSIFISSFTGKKPHPLSVHAIGGRHIFPANRNSEDHVYCMFEFPGPGYEPGFDVGYKDPVTLTPDPERGIESYDKDKNKKIVVTYSSINGNGFGGYGEVVMGTKGTLMLDKEKEVMLFAGSSTTTRVGVRPGKGGPALDTTASGDGPVAKAAESAPVSRGYTEEIEHWAYCIRNRAPENRPRCHPEVALGDAVMALTAKYAIRQSESGKGGYIQFKDEWFQIDDDATPDGSKIDDEKAKLLG